MKADPSAQLALLQVQERDTRLTQLSHKADNLAERADLTTANERLERLRKEIIAAQTIVSDLEGDQRKADADVDLVRERARKDRELLDSGSIGDPKQLQNLQHELESLARRQSELEDVELEIMERLEGAMKAVSVLTAEQSELATRHSELESAIAAQMSVIDAERATVTEERHRIAAGLPADLVTLYEKVRADHGGLGAAPLHRGRCEGCHLQLPPQELVDIAAAPDDEVLRCEECRRILVRTPESGLS
ncbi:MAG: zinc ribbon domain-containing protein [Actinomycetota bacterium]